MHKFVLFFTVLLIFLVNSLTAQTDSTKSLRMVITLKDGRTVVGCVISSEKMYLTFLTVNDQKIKIAKDSIDDIIRFVDLSSKKQKQLLNPKPSKSYEVVQQQVQPDTTEEQNVEDMNLNRLVIFPTARPMKPWQGYAQLNEIFCPFVALSIDQLFIIGGGMSIVPGASGQLIYLSARTTPLHYKNLYVAGGVFYVNSTNNMFTPSFYSSGFSVAYGMLTYGDENKSLTAGLGYNLEKNYSSKKPVLIIGGDFRISKGVKIITENWIPPETDYFLCMLGLRFIGKHVSGDVAFMRVLGNHSKPSQLIPWLSFTYNFELVKKK